MMKVYFLLLTSYELPGIDLGSWTDMDYIHFHILR